MKKNLLSLVVGTAMLVPTLGFAVGLGSVRTYSHLNEKLRAEIPVLSVKKKGKMTVALASNAEFAKRGVQRSDVLSDLSFSLVERKGRIYVNVRSKKQIAAPYLNFILRLQTPEGVVSREYAIFLDPARASKKKPVTKSSSLATPYRSSRSQKTTGTQVVPAKQTVATKKATPSKAKKVNVSNARGGRYGPIRRGETLWSIASHTRPSTSISVSDMVRAIRRANPRTLANGLPAGVVISIPTIAGYPAYSGGYAPMPSGTSATSKKKPKKTTTKKKSPKKVTKSTPRVSDKSVKQRATKEVARPQKTTTAQSTASKTGGAIGSAIGLVGENIENVADSAQKTTDDLLSKAKDGINDSTDKVASMVDSATDSVGEASTKVAGTIESAFDGAKTTAKKAVETTTEGVENAIDDVKKAVAVDLPELPEEQGMTEQPAALKTDLMAELKPIEIPEPVTTPKVETPSVTTPKVETPSVTTPKVETPSVTTPKVETPSVTAPKVEKPSVTAPKVEKPSVTVPKVEKPKPPAVVKQSQPVAPPEPTILDKVVDNAPFIGGGALATLLGGYALYRRRKAKQNEVSLTDDDMATLLGEEGEEGEEDFDEFNVVEEDAIVDDNEENVDKMLTTIENDIDNLDDVDSLVDIDSLDDVDGLSDIGSLDDVDGLSDIGSLDDLGDIDSLDDLPEVAIDPLDDEEALVSVDLDTDGVDSLDNSGLDDSLDNVIDFSDNDILADLDDNTSDALDDVTELSDEGLAFELKDDDTDIFDVSDDKAVDIEDLGADENSLSFDLTGGDEDLLSEIEEEKPELASSQGVLGYDVDFVGGSSSSKGSEAVSSDEVALKNSDVGKVISDDLVGSAISKTKEATLETASRMQMKLDLASSFISISEHARAKELLKEIIADGSEEQVAQAQTLLADLT